MQSYSLKSVVSKALNLHVSAEWKVGDLFMVKHKQNVREPRASMLLVHHTCWVNCEFLQHTQVSNVVRANKKSIKTTFDTGYFQFVMNILV